MQAKLYWAVTSNTPSMVLRDRADADAHAKREYKKFDERRRALRTAEVAEELAALKVADKHLPKPKRPAKTPD